jgi:phosphoglycerol transferase MdoB-like AlkP superfamily enzyme
MLFQNNFLRSLFELLSVFLLVLFIFMIARVITIVNLIPDAYAVLNAHERWLYWKYSILFDLKTLTTVYAPCVVGCLFCSTPQKLNQKFCKFTGLFYPVTVACSLLAVICNYFYFKTYGRTFDVMIKGLMNEDFTAVILSIWDGYPVVLMVLLIISVTILYILFQRWFKRRKYTLIREKERPRVVITTLFLLILLVWPVLVRGGIGTFPLRRSEVAVTPETKVNGTVANGLISFFWTVTHLNMAGNIKPVDLKDLARDVEFFGLEFSRDEPMASLRQITSESPRLEQIKPNVVFALMESMSTDMLQLDNQDSFDVYGRLRNVISHPDTYMFRHFISEGDGTIDTLQRIIVNSGNFMDLSVSLYGRKSFETSIAKPFKKAGYKTYFISAGLSSWRSLGDFVKNQGFDLFVDQADIVRMFPNAELSTWGVYDQYMFDAAAEILKNTKEPVMIFMLSVTNHPPYKIPDNFPKMNRVYVAAAEKYKTRDIYDMYDTFHYANDQLGGFISKIISEPTAKDRTVIAFTGDHNVRGLNVYNQVSDQIMGHQVPFFMYIPRQVRDSVKHFEFNQERFASHKDIMPTLFNISLSQIEYYSTGCNLFEAEDRCIFNFAFNGTITVNSDGLCITDDINYSKNYLYRIDRENFRGVNETNEKSSVCRTAAAYNRLLSDYRAYQTVGIEQGD